MSWPCGCLLLSAGWINKPAHLSCCTCYRPLKGVRWPVFGDSHTECASFVLDMTLVNACDFFFKPHDCVSQRLLIICFWVWRSSGQRTTCKQQSFIDVILVFTVMSLSLKITKLSIILCIVPSISISASVYIPEAIKLLFKKLIHHEMHHNPRNFVLVTGQTSSFFFKEEFFFIM